MPVDNFPEGCTFKPITRAYSQAGTERRTAASSQLTTVGGNSNQGHQGRSQSLCESVLDRWHTCSERTGEGRPIGLGNYTQKEDSYIFCLFCTSHDELHIKRRSPQTQASKR